MHLESYNNNASGETKRFPHNLITIHLWTRPGMEMVKSTPWSKFESSNVMKSSAAYFLADISAQY